MSRDWSVYDEAALLDQVSHLHPDGSRAMILRVQGLRCGACVGRLEKALAGDVAAIHCDVASGSCELRWDPQHTVLSAILCRLDEAGFPPLLIVDDAELRAVRDERRAGLARIGVSLLLGMQVMMLASGEYFGEVDAGLRPLLRHAQWLLATPVALYSGWPFLRAGWRSLLARSPTMDAPVAVAISAAYLASAVNTLRDAGAVYFDSVAMFVLLLSIARYFEQKGRARAAERLRRLAGTQPLTARRRDAEGLHEVSAQSLRAGDVIVIAPGEAVAADGESLGPPGEFDESLLTGEAIPRLRAAGHPLCAGSVNCGSAPVSLRVTQVGAATTLSQITRLVHRALASRPRVQVWADRLAGRFVLGVLALAALSALWWLPDTGGAFNAALAVLVITCPCALSLATPATLAAAVTRLARSSVLLVRADALMRLPDVDTVCLDKTGTLTTRGLRIARTQTLSALGADDALAVAGGLEAGCHHPIARAFPASSLTADQLRIEAGVGVFGRLGGQQWSLTGIDTEKAGDQPGGLWLRWLSLRRDEVEVARFALAEELRPGVPALIGRLRAAGLAVELLSGDRELAAQGVGSFVGATRALGGRSPADKLARLQALQAAGHRVLAIGDGVNDGPLLAGADVSVGIASGAALAQAHGDAILISDELDGIGELFTVARKARRIVHQNLAWALGYNLVMVPLAVAGLVTPWLAALGMGASSLLVTANALRVLRAPQPAALPPGRLHRIAA